MTTGLSVRAIALALVLMVAGLAPVATARAQVAVDADMARTLDALHTGAASGAACTPATQKLALDAGGSVLICDPPTSKWKSTNLSSIPMPVPGATNVVRFGAGGDTGKTTAQVYSWVVPAGVTAIRVKAWGAGGGGNTSVSGSRGGAGGFAQADFNADQRRDALCVHRRPWGGRARGAAAAAAVGAGLAAAPTSC